MLTSLPFVTQMRISIMMLVSPVRSSLTITWAMFSIFTCRSVTIVTLILQLTQVMQATWNNVFCKRCCWLYKLYPLQYMCLPKYTLIKSLRVHVWGGSLNWIWFFASPATITYNWWRWYWQKKYQHVNRVTSDNTIVMMVGVRRDTRRCELVLGTGDRRGGQVAIDTALAALAGTW